MRTPLSLFFAAAAASAVLHSEIAAAAFSTCVPSPATVTSILHSPPRQHWTQLNSSSGNNNIASQEAERLLARAKEIRESIPESAKQTASVAETVATEQNEEEEEEVRPASGYRLYVDIGREPGTWMDPRWGASGARIEFTLDVDFLLPCMSMEGEGVDISEAPEEIANGMVKDNFGGKSSVVRLVQSAETARLRGGFDKMVCRGGGYRIDVDSGKKGSAVTRFFIAVDGTPEKGSSYGDIFIPRGNLYFSLPCFGSSISNLSAKEGPVTVRQIGWHTGWRREESRIVGVFRAKKIEEARIVDNY